MRLSYRLAFTVVVALVAAGALLETRGWPIKAALYPRAVAAPLLLLALGESLLILRAKGDEDEEEPADFAMTTSVAPALAARRTAVMITWIGGFFAAVVLLGFQIATPLFIFAYVKGQGREGWVLALLLPVFAVVGFHVLFVSLLHLPLPAGLLWQALNQ